MDKDQLEKYAENLNNDLFDGKADKERLMQWVNSPMIKKDIKEAKRKLGAIDND